MLVLMVTLLFMISAITGSEYGTKNWNQKLMYKATANLTCEDANFDPMRQQDANYHWLLPSGEVVGIVTQPSNDRYNFVNNGSTLLIKSIDKTDFGVYFCLVTTNSERLVYRSIKLGLNVDGPYFGDLWERYSPNLKMGFLASGVVFLIMSMFCYNLSQFQDRYDRPKKYQQSNNVDISLKTYYTEGNIGNSNSAFVPDLHESNDGDAPDTEIITDTVLEPKTKL
uniref:Ig-like domain-containing protein n=1 Tax=Arion vulgaris TaxID=1028688 RepID=A0A0B7A588_9EUPU